MKANTSPHRSPDLATADTIQIQREKAMELIARREHLNIEDPEVRQRLENMAMVVDELQG